MFTLIGLPPDLMDHLTTHLRFAKILVVAVYKDKVWEDECSLTRGQQYRRHMRDGGYRP